MRILLHYGGDYLRYDLQIGWSIVHAVGRCQLVLLRTVLSKVLVASRHSARRSGVWGANLQNVPLDRVPFAGSAPLKGRQADFYKYQSG